MAKESSKTSNDDEGWTPIGSGHISTDDYEWHEWGLEAKGAYYRVAHMFQDTHPAYSGNPPWYTYEPRHRAKVMIRLLGDSEPSWVRAIKRREKRRKDKKG